MSAALPVLFESHEVSRRDGINDGGLEAGVARSRGAGGLSRRALGRGTVAARRSRGPGVRGAGGGTLHESDYERHWVERKTREGIARGGIGFGAIELPSG